MYLSCCDSCVIRSLADILGVQVSEVFFTLRKFGCNNNSRHHLPKRVCQSLGRLDSLGFHTFLTNKMSAFTASLAQSTISDTAQVKYHEGNKAPPIMLPGHVTPALLLQWEEHTTAYFDKAKTPKAEKVSSVLACWRDSEIDNFI